MQSSPPDSESRRVGEFFHGYAVDFDSIYGGKRNPVSRLLDRLFRRAMVLRFALTRRDLALPKYQRVLDVGCGSGRYALELLRMGKDVTGVDLAAGMLEVAQRVCSAEFPKDRYRFFQGGYPGTDPGGPFDAALLIGFFDYIRDADAVITALRKDVTGIFVASFPRGGGVLALQRKLRYRMRGVPLYFYTEASISILMKRAGITDFTITDLGRDMYVRAELPRS